MTLQKVKKKEKEKRKERNLQPFKGMKYLQSMVPPIIHRDLRSPNIFLMSNDPAAKVTAKVADFGLSRLVETKIGGVLGTWQVNC